MLDILEVSCRRDDGWLGALSVGELRFCELGGTPMTRQAFAERVRGKRVLNFAHGYHNREAQADHTAKTVAERVAAADLNYDVMVLFSWSGGLTFAGFGMAVARTKACGKKLAELLEIESFSGARSIDCASHSLGAGVTAEALLDLGKNESPAYVERWIALAAAIPDQSLSPGRKYDVDMLPVGWVLVLYSFGDAVLEEAYPLGSFFKCALGRHGPDGLVNLRRVKAIDVTRYVHSHSEAYTAPEVYTYWKTFSLRLI